MNRTNGVLAEVQAERETQDARWGTQRHDPLYWLAILTEEVGEVAKELAEGRISLFDGDAYRQELIQVAAVATAAVESYDALRAWTQR